jgi:hypothetical protein
MNPTIEKIKKLLRLARDKSATPAESAAALAKAIAMATESGIDLDKVSTDDNSQSLNHRTTSARFGSAERNACSIIRKHLNVDALFSNRGGKNVVHLYGFPEACDLAVYVFVYLVRCAKSSWKNRANKRLKNRDAYIYGFFLGIDELMPEKFHQPGLLPAFNAYRDEVLLGGSSQLITKRIAPKNTPIKSLTAGYMAGKKNGINNAIPGTDKPLIG